MTEKYLNDTDVRNGQELCSESVPECMGVNASTEGIEGMCADDTLKVARTERTEASFRLKKGFVRRGRVGIEIVSLEK